MVLFRAFALSAFVGLFALGTAQAQTPSPLASWQFAPGVVLSPLGGPAPTWSTTVGGGADINPLYEGSSKYRVRFDPTIDVRYKDLAFFSIGEGIGLNVLRGTTYRAGIAVDYDLGRRADDDTRTRGTGNIAPAPAVKLFAEYTILPVVIRADLRRIMGGADGFIGTLGAYLPVVGNETVQVFVGPSLTFADGTYMRHYFGVSASQSLRSGLPQHDAGDGLKNANFGVTGLYHFTPKWFIEGDAAIEQLVGGASSSPIVARSTQFTMGLNLGYTF